MSEPFENDPPPTGLSALRQLTVPPEGGGTAVTIHGGIITAQQVAVRRDPDEVLARIKRMAKVAFDIYYYRIPFKDHDTGRVNWVEGPTIKLALDVAREWGNCQLDTRVIEEADCWIVHARFVDLERGFSLVRPFRQRKSQRIGFPEKARERELDIVFAIGVSKALRNVVTNSLTWLTNYAWQEAKTSLRDSIEEKPDAYRKRIAQELVAIDAALPNVERIVGRSMANWTVPDMVGIHADIVAIGEGMTTVDDAFPDKDAPKEPKGEGAAPGLQPPKPAEAAQPTGDAAEAQPATAEPQPAVVDASLLPLFAQPIEEPEFTPRTVNALKGGGIMRYGDLVQKTAAQLKHIYGFGGASLDEVNRVLSEQALTLGMTIINWPPAEGAGPVEPPALPEGAVAQPAGGYILAGKFYGTDGQAEAAGFDAAEGLPEGAVAQPGGGYVVAGTFYGTDEQAKAAGAPVAKAAASPQPEPAAEQPQPADDGSAKGPGDSAFAFGDS